MPSVIPPGVTDLSVRSKIPRVPDLIIVRNLCHFRLIENGRSSINVEDLFKILKYLGCDKYELKMIIYRIYFVLDGEDAIGSLEYAVLAIGLIGVIIILYSVAT